MVMSLHVMSYVLLRLVCPCKSIIIGRHVRKMVNWTNCSEDGGYGLGNSILAVILMLLLMVILILFVGTIILLCKAHSMVRILRIFLVNLLVAGMVTLVLDHSPAMAPDCLATFSLIVLSIVRYHKKDIKMAYIIGLLVLIW